MKSMLAKVSPAALCVALAGPAFAGPTYEAPGGGTMTWYGHLNAGVASVNDGDETNTKFGDGSNSSSRLGLRVAQPLGNGMTFRFRGEASLGFTGLADYDQDGITNNPGWTRGNIRHFDFSLGGDFGTLWAGQGSMSADGIANNAFSDVGLVLYTANSDFNASYAFVNEATGAPSGVAVGDAYDDLGGSRRGRVRYDSPEFAGFSASASWGKNILSSGDDNDYSDVVLSYNNEFGAVDVTGAVAYQYVKFDGGGSENAWVGSVGIGFDNGLSFSVASGKANTTNDENYYYLQAAYDADFFSVGKTALGVDYFSGEDYNSAGSKSEIVGIGAVQYFDKQNVEAYLTYQMHSFDEVATNYKDVSTFALGAWRAPIGWSGLIVSASLVSGPSARCFPARAGGSPKRCAA